MWDWLRRRRERQAALRQQERRMAEALSKLDELSCQQINGHEVESIEQEIAEATDKAIAILEPETANGTG